MLRQLPRFSGHLGAVLAALLTACGGASQTPPSEAAQAESGAPRTSPEARSDAPPQASQVGSQSSSKGESTPGDTTAQKGSKTAPDNATETPDAQATSATTSPAAKAAALPLPAGTRVLHVGDSFAGALGLPLNKRLKAANIHAILQFETASYIPGWASGDKLSGYINRYDPDLVLITLGANELEIVNPEQRIRNIQKIVKTIGDRPCVWVATPLWDGAKNGLFEIIRQNIAPCLYMDTNALITSMPRVADGIHPTLPAREDWADVVVKWLSEHRKPTAEKAWALAE